jgi:hypothetical protein
MARPRSPNTSIGPFSKNSAANPHYAEPRESFAVPERVTNSSSRQPLELSKEWGSPKRPGSMDAFSLLSRGTRC